jgi:hypothetical protein
VTTYCPASSTLWKCRRQNTSLPASYTPVHSFSFALDSDMIVAWRASPIVTPKTGWATSSWKRTRKTRSLVWPWRSRPVGEPSASSKYASTISAAPSPVRSGSPSRSVSTLRAVAARRSAKLSLRYSSATSAGSPVVTMRPFSMSIARSQ